MTSCTEYYRSWWYGTIWMSLSQELEFFKLVAILSNSSNSTSRARIFSSVSRVFIILIYALIIYAYNIRDSSLVHFLRIDYRQSASTGLIPSWFLNFLFYFKIFWLSYRGLKQHPILYLGMSCHCTNLCTLYRISLGTLSKNLIEKLLGTTFNLIAVPWVRLKRSQVIRQNRLTICNIHWQYAIIFLMDLVSGVNVLLW